MKSIFTKAALVAATTLCLPGLAGADVNAPLADKIPSDALLYVGWSGAEQARALGEGSHAMALLDESNLPTVFNETLPTALRTLSENVRGNNDELANFAQIAADLYPMIAKYPTAVAFGGITDEWAMAPGEVVPKLLFVCQAGPDAEVLRGKLTALFQQFDQVFLVTLLEVQDDTLYLNLAWPRLDVVAAGEAGEGALQNSVRFQEAFDGLAENPMKAWFVDVPGMIDEVVQTMEREENFSEAEQMREFLDLSGLGGIGNIAATASF
ncbi:MAG: hypothetical protein AAGK78_12865, partial [Planctomycetota bacterium]